MDDQIPDGSEARTKALVEEKNRADIFGFYDYKFIPLPEDFHEDEVTKLLWFYEFYWLRYAKSPSIDDILGGVELSPARIRKYTNSDSFHLRLQLRGIPWPDGWLDTAEAEVVSAKLTPIQMVALGILSDPTSRGSLKSKLERIGVSYSQYRNWMNNTEFAKAMNQIGEKMVVDNIATVHQSLVGKAQAGDVQAMKLFYEVSGRHDPMRQQSLDLNRIVALLLEVITRNVTDIGTLTRIQDEFDSALSIGQISANPAGDAVHKYAEEVIAQYSSPAEEVFIIEE